MPTSSAIYPTANGTNQWNTSGNGNYTAVDDAVTAPTAPTDTPQASERIYAGAGGSLTNRISWTIPQHSGYILTRVRFYTYKYVTGSVSTNESHVLSGDTLGDHTSSGTSGGWAYVEWNNLGLNINDSSVAFHWDLVGPTTLGKGDTETEWSAAYLVYDYEDISGEDACIQEHQHSSQDGTSVTLNGTGTFDCDDNDQYVAYRFRTLYIPQGDTINSAYILVPTEETIENNVDVYGEDIDDPTDLSASSSDISGRTQTTATDEYGDNSAADGTVPGGTIWRCDVTDQLQEIVNRGGWVSGNDAVFIFRGQSAGPLSFEFDFDEDAYLCIDAANWTDPGSTLIPAAAGLLLNNSQTVISPPWHALK